MFEGPENEYVGGGWAFTSALPGAPGGLNNGPDGFQLGETPRNGFEGRLLITSGPLYTDWAGNTRVSRAPTPQGDKISRGVSPVANSSASSNYDPKNTRSPEYLIYSALSTPCTNPGNLRTPVVAPPVMVPPGTSPAPTIPTPTTPPTGTTLTGSGTFTDLTASLSGNR